MPAKKASGKRATKKGATSSRANGKRAARSGAKAAKKSAKKVSRKGARKSGAAASAQQVLVVNMIPRALSGETHQDSEPTIAVNPANPLQIAGSAFTPDPARGPNAPIYISTDGGNTWTLNSIVPGANRTTGTGDITIQFSRTTNILYVGILRGDSRGLRMNILRTKNFAGSTPMEILVDRMDVDQPYVQVSTTNGAGGKDRLYVGNNDLGADDGITATIDESLDAGSNNPNFKKIRVESRATGGQDGPPVRPAIHADGTVYAVYHSWRTYDDQTGLGTADIVVVRDDNGGSGANPFKDLVDANDGKAGVRVVTGTRFNFNGSLGNQRTGGDVAIAVDQTNSDIVYIAYNDDHGADYVLHLLRSKDRGRTWSADLRTIRNALNPALAVNNAGRLGFLYQQLTGTGASERWVTKLELTKNGTNWNTLTLARVPNDAQQYLFDPFLGDYAHLMAVGADFYGVFSANNTPRKANFPNGVKYQRNADFNANTLLNVNNTSPVKTSIDPFFFKVTG